MEQQTLKEIEIIIVDDGSTDGSAEICDIYGERDKRFKVFHKANKGISAARNDGIQLSCGKYIMWVDSDDWVVPNFCEVPYRLAEENNIDVVCFQYFRHTEDDDVANRFSTPEHGIVSSNEAVSVYWLYVTVYCWNKIYKRTLFDEVQYPVGHLSEDAAIIYQLVQKADKAYLINEALYHHRVS